MRKGFRVILVPEGQETRLRQFFLGSRTIRIFAVIILLFTALIVSSLFLTTKFSVLSYRVSILERENRALREENSKIAELRRRIEELQDFRRRLAFLLGVQGDTTDLRRVFLSDRESERERIGSALSLKELESSPYEPLGIPVEGIFSRAFSLSHPAVDIVAPFHAPILATANGIVAEAGWDSVLGNFVFLKHGDLFKTIYGHLSRVTVSKGTFVKRGDLLGFVGNTGRSTGPHLHYEVWKEGKRVDPRRFITTEISTR